METIGCTGFQVRITAKHPDPSSPRSSARKGVGLLNPDLVITPVTQDVNTQLEPPANKNNARGTQNDGRGIAPAIPQPPAQQSTGAQSNLILQTASTSTTAGLSLHPHPPCTISSGATGSFNNASTLNHSSLASEEREEQRQRQHVIGRMNWGLVEIPIEVTESQAEFPFTDVDVEDVVSQGKGHVQSRDRLAKFALEVQSRQHRTHVYTIAICRDQARFQRHDRAGCVVSASFNYLEDPRPIGTFLYKLFRNDCVTRESRGHDPTAELASADEAQVFRDVVRAHGQNMEDYVRVMFRQAAADGWPIYKLKIRSPWSLDGKVAVKRGDQEKLCSVLVGRPVTSTASLTERRKKGFVGWHEDGYPVYVKDTWRVESDRLLEECDTYHTLWSSEDAQDIEHTHVPTLLGGGDVHTDAGTIQRTLKLTPKIPLSYIHVRLVFKEICRDLETFEDARELTAIVCRAILGTECSYLKADMRYSN